MSSEKNGEVVFVTVRSGPLPVRIRLRGHPFDYLVRAGRTPDGPVLLGLEIRPDDGHVITSQSVQRLPAKRLAAAAAKLVVFPRDDLVGGQLDGPDFENYARPDQPQRETSGRRGRPVLYDDAHYRAVAEEARRARAEGSSARAAIAKRFHTSEPNADRWMRAARARGLLQAHPASRGGKR